MKYILTALVLFASAACASAPQNQATISEASDVTAIKELLETQKHAWNTGSIDGFMEGYWQSPELRFASGGKVTKGWQKTLNRYRTNYSDRAKMGQLDFSDLEVNQLSADAAILHGRWKLTRAEDTPHGLFTLVMRKMDGRWFIISDTTTSGGS